MKCLKLYTKSMLFMIGLTSCSVNKDELLSLIPNTPATSNIRISSASASSVHLSSASVNYQITYKDVLASTLKNSDVLEQTTGNVVCAKSVSNVTVSGATVSFNNCSGNGTLRFKIAAGSATDLTGLQIGESSNSASFVIDNAGVSTASFMISPGLYSTIPAAINVNFPEVVNPSSISISDFSLSGSCAGVAIGEIIAYNTVATVNLIGASGCIVGETVVLTVQFSGITDALGNAGSGSSAGTYTVTNIGPTSGIFLPASSAVSSSLSSFTLTLPGFIDASTVVADDFSISGNCAGVTISGTSIVGSEVTVQLSGINMCAHGQTIIVSTDLSGISDVSGNVGAGMISAIYTVDKNAPTLTFSLPTSTMSVIPSMLDVTFSIDTDMSAVTSANFSLSGTCPGVSISTVTKLLNVATVQIAGSGICNNTETVQLDVDLTNIKDTAGNSATGLNFVVYTLDSQGPHANLSLSSSVLNSIPGSMYATFDSDTDMNTVTAADFSISGTCGALLTGIVKTGAVVTLNLSGVETCTDNQTVVITENFSGVADLLGNAGTGSESTTLTIDSVGPIATFSLTNSTLNTLPVTVDVTMSADTNMNSVTADQFLVSGTCGATLNSIIKSGNLITINLDGTSTCTNAQTIIITANQNSVLDLVGNAGSGTVILTLTLDNVGPTVSIGSLTGRYNPLPSSISATFSADTDMSTVDALDFTFGGTCTVSINSINIAGQTATVNLDGTLACTQDHTVEITLYPASVMDYSGNTGLNTPVIFTYTFDQVGPEVTFSPLGGSMAALPTSVTMTFDTDTNISSVTVADFSISGTCSASLISISKSDNIVTLNLSGTSSCSSGTNVSITAVLTDVQDQAGNAGVGSQVQTYTKE